MSTTEIRFPQLPPGRPREVLLSVLEKLNFNTSDTMYDFKTITVGCWFSSVYFLEASTTTGNLRIYIKCHPKDPLKIQLFLPHLHFQNEATFYNMVIPAFQQLQREKCPHDHNVLVLVPHCYAAEFNGKNDIVILQDMCASGFVLLDRLQPMKLPEMCLLLEELGRFHGFSLAMKIQMPQTFLKIKESLVEPTFSNELYDRFSREIQVNNLEDILTAVKQHYEKGNLYLEEFEKFIPKALDLLPLQAATDISNEPYNVIVHSDLWINNYLFHYGEHGKGPDKVCLLDFQQIRYNSPAIDLGRLLYGSMDGSTRVKHRDELLQCYHNSLSKTVRQLGCNPEHLLPYDELETQFKKFSVMYLLHTFLNLQHALDEYEGTQQVTVGGKEELFNSVREVQQRMTDKCLRRIFDVIEEVVDRGYMDLND